MGYCGRLRIVNLVNSHSSWRKEYEAGEKPCWPHYEEYVKNRNSEMWRTSSAAERFYEYVMWLEQQLKEKEE
ncbi:hypothetical protein D3C85_748950 [compost metagenome]